MSIYVHVKHYLTSEGIEYFDGWFKQVHAFMSQSSGFVSLTSEKFPKEGMVHIVLCFNSESKLDAWVKQPVHDKLVEQLDTYRSKSFWEAARTQNEAANWKAIAYDRIQSPGSSPKF